MHNTERMIIQWLGTQDYQTTWEAMRTFTQNRDVHTSDEIWLLEHLPAFTQGQNGKPEHILRSSNIPIIQTDRGGQVTYHGPGQLMVYTLIDIQRKKWNIRQCITWLEESVIAFLAQHNITATTKREAPGIYIDHKKIGSVGLRVRKGYAYHGLALNVAMDLEPFTQINPCGDPHLKMTQLSEWGIKLTVQQCGLELSKLMRQNN